MRNMGLIRGADLTNAVCFNASTVMNPEGLRFGDEPCRHKVLDLIGDLALCGFDLAGHVVAYRSGHALNVELARTLAAAAGSRKSVSPHVVKSVRQAA